VPGQQQNQATDAVKGGLPPTLALQEALSPPSSIDPSTVDSLFDPESGTTLLSTGGRAPRQSKRPPHHTHIREAPPGRR
jgi:hypothetical protein